MAIKLIAIDMDGTLLLPDHTISPAVKAAIAAARERGVNVVLTTGRPYAGVHSYLKELHMEQIFVSLLQSRQKSCTMESEYHHFGRKLHGHREKSKGNRPRPQR